MTAAKKIKNAIIAHLGTCELDPDISIVDADIRADLELPTLAVAVRSIDSHSQALNMVHRADVEIIMRSHTGDETESNVQAWADQVESALHDSSSLVATFTDDDMTVYEWTYNGAQTEWDESTSEVTFAASILVQRLS